MSTNHESPHVTAAEQDKAKAFLQGVLTRSATDLEFRKRLLANPRGALSEYVGATFPDSLDVTFIENTADATIVLPDPVDAEAEISEAELETVAGGTGWSCLAATIFATMAIANSIKKIGDDDAWLS
jgi:hypothetical protein